VVRPEDFAKSDRIIGRRGRRAFGASVFTSAGDEHRRRRQLLQGVFNRDRFRTFAGAVGGATQRMLSAWRPGEEIDLSPALLGLTQEIITRMLFGRQFPDVGDRFMQALAVRRRYLEESLPSLWPLFDYWPFRINAAYAWARREINAILAQALSARRNAAPADDDLLSLLMHARRTGIARLSDQEVADEVRAVAIAGYETLAEALTWALCLLVQHPAEEERLYQEIGEVCAERPPGLDDVPRLSFARCVLAEAMRLYPPTWLFVRVSRRPTVLPSGAALPRGAKVYLSQYVVHRQERYFSRPERFDPSRFQEPGTEARPRLAYFPFGGGSRQCLGEQFSWHEGVLILSAVVQRFKLALVPGQAIKPDPNMTLRPAKGIRMRPQPRTTGVRK
jgi:cytochrome P450